MELFLILLAIAVYGALAFVILTSKKVWPVIQYNIMKGDIMKRYVVFCGHMVVGKTKNSKIGDTSEFNNLKDAKERCDEVGQPAIVGLHYGIIDLKNTYNNRMTSFKNVWKTVYHAGAKQLSKVIDRGSAKP